MKTILTILLCALAGVASAQTALMFAWEPSLDTNCAGYKLLSGTASRAYTVTNTFLGSRTTVGTASNVPPGRTFHAVVAFDTTGLDSDFSNEVMWTNRLPAPHLFRLVGTMQASLTPTGPWRDLARVVVPAPSNTNETFFRAIVVKEEETPALAVDGTVVSTGRKP